MLPKLIAEVESDPVKLYELKPVVFEQLVAELLSAYGWRVHLTSATKDGGFDIFAISKDVSGLETSWLVECKRWAENRPVGVEIVRSLYGVKSDLHVANALLATTSRFTSGVEEFGRRNYDLALSDFHDICRWIREYRPQKGRKIHLQKESLILPVGLRKKT